MKLCGDICEAVNLDQFRSQLAVESHGFLCLNSVAQSKAKSIVFVISKLVFDQYTTNDSEWMIGNLGTKLIPNLKIILNLSKEKKGSKEPNCYTLLLLPRTSINLFVRF